MAANYIGGNGSLASRDYYIYSEDQLRENDIAAARVKKAEDFLTAYVVKNNLSEADAETLIDGLCQLFDDIAKSNFNNTLMEFALHYKHINKEE